MKLIFIKLHLFKIMSQLLIWLDIKIKQMFSKSNLKAVNLLLKSKETKILILFDFYNRNKNFICPNHA